MRSVRFQNILWTPQNAGAERILGDMADFCGFSRTDDTSGVAVTAVTAGELHRGGIPGYCAMLDGNELRVLDHVVDPMMRFLRMRQIFYFGLLPFLGENCLPVHGALASFNGRGVLFLGQSGMGKSTTVGRLNSPWQIYADDAVLLAGNQACALPTWSCGYSGAKKVFDTTLPQVELAAVCLLRRGPTELTPLQGASGRLMPAFMDIMGQFSNGLPNERRMELHHAAFAAAVHLAETMPCYTLRLNLHEEFVPLLENVIKIEYGKDL